MTGTPFTFAPGGPFRALTVMLPPWSATVRAERAHAAALPDAQRLG